MIDKTGLYVPQLCGEVEPSILRSLPGGTILQRKFDGTRCVAYIEKNRVRLIGRSFKNDYADRYPQICRELYQFFQPGTVVDGELTFFDKSGKDVFITALATPETQRKYTVRLVIFDLLRLGGKDTAHLPYQQRLYMLYDYGMNGSHVALIESYLGNYEERFDSIVNAGGEGVVIKKPHSPYVQGDEGRKVWKKIKAVKTMDCYVCGMTRGTGARSTMFGALLLCTRENNRWQFRGRASGMSNEELKNFYKQMMSRPFASNFLNVSIPDALRIINPYCKVEVKYLDITDNGMLRQPRFIRVKE